MTQKIEQSQRQERVAAWNRRAECDLAAFQNSPKQTYQAEKARDRKLCANLEEAIRRSGLQDGMTVSFHHAFRGGDLTVNMVMDVIAKMGFKNLTLASSSLSDCHAPLVEHIRQGVVTRIYTSGLRGPLAEEISRGLLAEPVQIHSHGGRVHLVQSGELNIDVAFLGVPSCDEFGNANGYSGKACCGSLGYAMVDADNAKQVVMLTEELLPYPHNPASIEQDQVDLIVKVDRVGDAAKIGAGATRMTTNPRELLIARSAADVIVNSGYFKEGFSMQTGTGGASLAVTRFLEDKMRSRDIRADFALGGGDHGVNLGRLCQSIFFIQRHIGFDLILDSVDALIQSFSQFHGADFFINEFIMQFMSSALVKIHSSSSLSYSITRGTLKPPLWTAGAFFSASS